MNDFFTELDSDLRDIKKVHQVSQDPSHTSTKTHVGSSERVTVPEIILPGTTPHGSYSHISPSSRLRQEIPRALSNTDVLSQEGGMKTTPISGIPKKKQVSRETYENISIRPKKEMQEESTSNFAVTGLPPSIFPKIKSQSLPILPQGHTRVIALGGYGEVGKNMTMYQYGEEILLVDGGIQFTKNALYEAKYSLPDISILFPVKNKITGIVITNAHYDHIAGLKHLLPGLGYPKIYGTKFTIACIKREMESVSMTQNIQFCVIDPAKKGIFPISAHIKIELFSQNSNIPDAVGVYIETPNAKIVHTGDFSFDSVPSSHNTPNFVKLRQIGDRGISLLVSDSTHSMRDGISATESEINAGIHEIISQASGRIIIALAESLIGRIGQIIESAEKTGRTVFLNGKSIIDSVNGARDAGSIRCAQNAFQRISSKIDSLPDNHQIILTTGSQGEIDSGLLRIIQGDNAIISIRPGDTVVLSSVALSGSEQRLTHLMNALIRLGATLFAREGMDIYSSGHASREDQKMMYQLIHPRNFLPMQGELFMRVAHKKTILTEGLSEKCIFLLDNGSILDIDERGNVLKHKIGLVSEEMIVDGHGIGIATSHVIEARSQMMKAGVVTLIFKADEKTKMLLGHLKIETRGLLYVDEVRTVHKMIIKKARASYEDTVKDVPDIEEKDLIKIIRRDLEIFLQYRIERNPVIIPIIVYV